MTAIEQSFSLAWQYHQEGNLAQAEQLYRQILQAEPGHSDAWCFLGAICQARGNVSEAESSFRRAIQILPAHPSARNCLGILLAQRGQFEEAGNQFQELLNARPMDAEALNNLGLVRAQQRRWNDAVALFRQALQIRPDFVNAQKNLANAIQEQDRRPDRPGPSVATQAQQDAAEASRINNRAIELAHQGKFHDAVAQFEQAARLAPHDASYHNNLANVFYYLGRYDDAIARYRRAVQLRPNYPEAFSNLGNLLLEKGFVDDSLAQCRESVRLKPDYAGGHNNLGNALREKGRYGEAESSYQQALRFDPLNPDAHSNLAAMYKDQGRIEEAAGHFEQALKVQPSNKTRIMLATMLPPLYRSTAELADCRRRLIENVRGLHEERVVLDLTKDAAQPPFFLVYQGFNDVDVQRDIVKLYVPPPVPALPARAPGNGKIKVGFASKYFRAHTIGRLMRGTIANLSRDLFEVAVLSMGKHDDAWARDIQKAADRYLELPPNLISARRIILDQQLDALIYTDIGMDPVTYSLAFSRLAPVQCVTWGHGVTTGIPAMDYFISCELLETEESKGHYSEQLVRLKHPAVHYYRPVPPSPLKNRSHFGLPESGTLYGCPQTLFKFHPEFDAILASVLRRDPKGFLVLIEGKFPHWTKLIKERFAKTLGDVTDRIRFVPGMDHPDYLNLTALADVLLDPIHFGGGNTSYEGLALGVPIVTLPTQMLRGRITLMLYRLMGLDDCVAHSPDDYVERVVRLGTDPGHRMDISAKILKANGVLFENSAGVRDLERFLQQAVAAGVRA